MWITFLILIALALIVLIGGAIFYYFLAYNKSWNELNIWVKIGLIFFLGLELFLASTGVFLLIFISLAGSKKRKSLIRIPYISREPPRKAGYEIYYFFQSLNLEPNLALILQILLQKLLNVDFKRDPVVLNDNEVEILRDKINEFIKYYYNHKLLLDEELILYKENSKILEKYIFQIAPSNRLIAYYFDTLREYIDVEPSNSIRISQDLDIRALCRSIYVSMVDKIKTLGLDEIPSRDLIDASVSCLLFTARFNTVTLFPMAGRPLSFDGAPATNPRETYYPGSRRTLTQSVSSQRHSVSSSNNGFFPRDPFATPVVSETE